MLCLSFFHVQRLMSDVYECVVRVAMLAVRERLIVFCECVSAVQGCFNALIGMPCSNAHESTFLCK